jgi:hypothetical protein
VSGTVLWIMCAVIVVALAAWLAVVGLAQRRPAPRRPGIERRRGRVQGATHTGGGRSVSPRRDEQAVPGEDPEETSVPGPLGRPTRKSGNPLDR